MTGTCILWKRQGTKASTMPRVTVVLLTLLVTACLAHHRTDDDFAFDNNDEMQIDVSVERVHPTKTANSLKRLWGVADTSAYVGRLFRLEIPKEAFSGDVATYKVRSANRKSLPKWMAVDSKHGILTGVPAKSDIGSHLLSVTAYGRNPEIKAIDTFTIEVRKDSHKPQTKSPKEKHCEAHGDELILVILLDIPFHTIKPQDKIKALMNLANFMGLDGDAFSIDAYNPQHENKTNYSIVLSGPGSVRQTLNKEHSAIYLNVGCSGHMWTKHKLIVHQLREQARDGTISDLIHLPVFGWKVTSHIHQVNTPLRSRRQVMNLDDGSGLYDDVDDIDADDDYSGYDDEDYNNEDDPITEITDKPVEIVPFVVDKSSKRTMNENNEVPLVTTEEVFPVVIVPESIPPTTTSRATTTPFTIVILPSNNTPEVVSASTIHPVVVTTVEENNPPLNTVPVKPITTTPAIPIETTVEDISTTLQDIVTSTEKTSTIIGRTTETIDFTIPVNSPPVLKHRLKKLAVTAGKAVRYIIPEDLFTDAEDGTKLTLSMFDIDNAPLKATSWIQFIPNQREVYGLPLEEDVSKWEYIIRATDSKGESAQDHLDITVQHHKGRRAVNHEFKMKLKVVQKYPSPVDWQIRVLEGLVNLFRDTDMDYMTVRNAVTHADHVEFVWTNDTFPKNICPTADIKRLMGILQSNEDGSPSAALSDVMSPEMKVKSVTWSGLGVCQAAPSTPPSAPPRHPDNFAPVPRNQVDHIHAIVGNLLVFKVPEDTFFDPEDGSARNLKMWVVRGDRSPLPEHHWLQFDTKNQEFYGLPTERDIGRKDYQLVSEDSGGKTANDGLIVEVNQAPTIKPNVEFVMTFEEKPQSKQLLSSALVKRKFIEKLANLFGDSDSSSIRIKSISDKPISVTWYNTSLPMDRCPDDEIQRLQKMIVRDDETLTDKVNQGLYEFDVMSVRLTPRGICAGRDTPVYRQEPGRRAEATDGRKESVRADDYLLTFVVPAVVLVCMVLVAGLVACALYRRRRTGKMSVGDDEERQAFRSKGIPVIFQDELDEKPDPSNKSPVIMKEEKPPLLPPPEYEGTEGGSPTPSHRAPYHPPPPFTASRESARAARPKATPTYRKPPPYVPP